MITAAALVVVFALVRVAANHAAWLATTVVRTDAFVKLQEVTGLNAVEATDLLWNTYSPGPNVWFPFAGIGVAAIIALVIFAKMARRWKDMDA